MKLFPILNINTFDNEGKTNEFYANSFADHLNKFHSSITKPHKHDFYLTVLFTKGYGTHQIDFNNYKISPGSLFFMLPGQTHDWTLSDDIDGYIFFHTKSFYDLLFPNKNLNEYPTHYLRENQKHLQLEQGLLPVFTNYFKSIVSENEEMNMLKYRKIGLLIDLVYIDSNRITNNHQLKTDISNSQTNYYQHLQLLIDNNYIKLKKPKNYADKLNITVKHLNKVVNKITKKSTSDLINERIILEAKRLISHGNLTFKEIAFLLEFEDYSYFSRFFKKNSGLTPSEFAKEFI